MQFHNAVTCKVANDEIRRQSALSEADSSQQSNYLCWKASVVLLAMLSSRAANTKQHLASRLA
jgi:hypothetical protein